MHCYRTVGIFGKALLNWKIILIHGVRIMGGAITVLKNTNRLPQSTVYEANLGVNVACIILSYYSLF